MEISIQHRVSSGRCDGEKKFVKRGNSVELQKVAKTLFRDPDGELLHSPLGPRVRDDDETHNRAFFYFKPRRIRCRKLKSRPTTAIGTEKRNLTLQGPMSLVLSLTSGESGKAQLIIMCN